MRKRRIRIHTAKCRRGCGKVLATTNRSIWGDEASKAKFQLICEGCLTHDERQEMELAIQGAVLRKCIS